MNSSLHHQPYPMPNQNISPTLDAYSDEESRSKILERNRRAASKCRQRKKEWVDQLIQKTEKLSQQNEYLRQVAMQLREETAYLKAQLAQRCQCKVTTNQASIYMMEPLPTAYNPYSTH